MRKSVTYIIVIGLAIMLVILFLIIKNNESYEYKVKKDTSIVETVRSDRDDSVGNTDHGSSHELSMSMPIQAPHVFSFSQSDAVLQDVISEIRNCARVSGYDGSYGLTLLMKIPQKSH